MKLEVNETNTGPAGQSQAETLLAVAEPALPKRSRVRSALANTWKFLLRNPLTLIGAVVLTAWILVALLAPVLAPYSPTAQAFKERNQAPSAQHLFGTDELGRDIFSRVLYGAQLSLPVGFILIALASLIGTVVGLVSGYLGGWVDEAMMRFTDLIFAFPTIILAMTIAAALGRSLINSVVAILVVWWPAYARTVRSIVLTIKSQDFILAARAIGATPVRIMWRQIFPNILGPVLVITFIDIGNGILIFSGLSFLGLGPKPTDAEWGVMTAAGVSNLDAWWRTTFPGLAIASVVLAFNFIGDGLRDLLDPRFKQTEH
ncbi:MAG TPA: ABC transporter permease [Chloroflexia bacterium]|nr:ABC transporter permease [Chloroflexia bacterium]